MPSPAAHPHAPPPAWTQTVPGPNEGFRTQSALVVHSPHSNPMRLSPQNVAPSVVWKQKHPAVSLHPATVKQAFSPAGQVPAAAGATHAPLEKLVPSGQRQRQWPFG